MSIQTGLVPCNKCGCAKAPLALCPACDSQQDPEPNGNVPVWALVIMDMEQRDKDGAVKYGTRLQGFNGRDFLRDAYEEALDLAVYLRGLIWERDNPGANDGIAALKAKIAAHSPGPDTGGRES